MTQGKPQPTTEDVGDLADKILTFLHLCSDDKHPISVPIASMDGAIPTMGDARSVKTHEFLIPKNDGAPAVWPVDVKMVIDADELTSRDGSDWPNGTLQFCRLRSIQTKDARRVGATKFSRFMLQNEMVAAMPGGVTKSGGGPYAFLGGKWLPSATKTINYPPDRNTAIQLGLGWQLALRYEWTVWIGYSNGPRIRFLSDPLGAREVFRLRDIPEGRERRAALRHWVTAHWRMRRNDDAETRAWVKKHLRGTIDFTWNGLRCRIEPAAYDIESLQSP